ncbi:hypothetical protein Tco_0079318 [Tanacetum coccineum]
MCGKCVCNLGAVIAKKQEDEKVYMFLMGLDESVYETARSNILAQDPLPNLIKVYLILIQEERVNTMMCGKDERPELMALATQNQAEVKNRSVICIKCMKTGHSANNCFEIHGYPEWASHHITGLIEKLTNIKEIVEWPVELPNGRMVMANKEGNIIFNNHLKECVIRPQFEDGDQGGDPSRTGEGSYFVPQDNVSSSSQSPIKETIKPPHEEELRRGCRKKEALVRLKDKRWCDAMDNELQALERNGIWTIENLPNDKKALGCKWVYKMKRESDRTVELLKA